MNADGHLHGFMDLKLLIKLDNVVESVKVKRLPNNAAMLGFKRDIIAPYNVTKLNRLLLLKYNNCNVKSYCSSN